MTTGSICGKLFPESRKMSVAKQQHSYQCDQCGSPNIAALSVLYEQGTRTYSSPTNWGSSQSYSAQGAAPPRRKGYGGPFLLWGFLLSFFLFWSWACYSAMLKYPKTASSMEYALGFLGLMVLGCVIGLVLTSRKVSRYNQAVFPNLYATWARTYMCHRCGKLLHIPS
jgi:DNA-directed RNA polymerase subunit RPC12/RpoP